MKTFTKIDLAIALKKIGVKKNSTILVHAGLNYIGKMQNIDNNLIPQKTFEILMKCVGKKGTVLFRPFLMITQKKIKHLICLNLLPASHWEYYQNLFLKILNLKDLKIL